MWSVTRVLFVENSSRQYRERDKNRCVAPVRLHTAQNELYSMTLEAVVTQHTASFRIYNIIFCFVHDFLSGQK